MASESAASKVQEIGRGVQDFSLPELHGSSRGLRDELTGRKAAVVVFWSCVCSHCIRYDEYLNGFAALHPEMALLAVASRRQETQRDLQQAVRQRKLTFPILVDADGAVAAQWFTQQTPRAFLIDSGFTLRYRGAIDNFQFPDDPDYTAYLEPAIADVLSGRPVVRPETPSFGCAISSVYYELHKIL